MNFLYDDENVMDDLYLVGQEKSIGYLPLITLKEEGISIDALFQFAKEHHLKAILLHPKETSIESGAIYLYHEEMLFHLLNAFQKDFLEAGVPIDTCESYVRFIAKNHISKDNYPNTYIAIGKTFNDHRFQS